MSISIHIPFYNPNPEKKEGYRNLTRFDYLKENISNLKTLSIKNDRFVYNFNFKNVYINSYTFLQSKS